MAERSLLIAGPGQYFAHELATHFAERNYAVALMGRNRRALRDLSAQLQEDGIRPHVTVADFNSVTAVGEAAANCAQVMPPWDCLIFNVKDSPRGDALSVDLGALAASLNANTLGALRLTRAAIDKWPRHDSASVLLAGGGYKDEPSANKLALSMSKGALHTMALAMAPVLLEQVGVSVREIVIDGVVRQNGPIYPDAVAEHFWHAHVNKDLPLSTTIVP